MRKLFYVIAFSLGLMLLISCATTKKTHISVPDIPYPEFPIDVTDPAVSITFSEGTVSIRTEDSGRNADIPLWLWLELTEYTIDVDSAIAQYKAVIKALNK